ncbi:MAG: S28 family serine protease [Saprospiraceae bacterium]|nr:hypothetical protein [Saprospiraceae bacterium]
MQRFFTLICCFTSVILFAKKPTDEFVLKNFLEEEFPGILIQPMDSKDGFVFSWELTIQQALDHWDSNAGSFPQKIFLYHRAFKNPNVIVTEGYEIADRIYEASSILNANQFSIEYRFFGDSRPEKINWSLLNHKQALEDLHSIRTKLAKIYKKNWIATGISKGGTTAALYSLTYPKDLKATIAYVAPFALEQEDKRTIEHYTKKVGRLECRQKVREFQRNLLKHRNEIKLLLIELENRDGVKFEIDKDKVIDFASMEYPFSFWQWGFACQDIPSKDAKADELFDHIEAVVDFNYYDNVSYKRFLPAYYQFMTEFGYYGFDTSGVSDLLIYPQLSNLEFAPKDADLTFHGEYINKMHEKARSHSNNMIYIYGAQDPWTSCAIELSNKSNALKLVKYNGAHRTRIRDFSESDKQLVYKCLKKWTKHKTIPLAY